MSATTPSVDSPRQRGLIHVSEGAARILRGVAWAIGGTAIAVLAVMAVLGLIPENPEGSWLSAVEVQAQIILMVVVGIGLVVSIRWPAVGATVVALAGTGLAVFAAIAYAPPVVVFMAAVFLVPSALLWLAWQRDETLARVAILAVVLVSLLGGAWYAGSTVYDRYFGAATAQSDTPALAAAAVRWAWAGGVTDRSFDVVVKPKGPASEVGLLVSSPGEEEWMADEQPLTDGVARLRADDLRAHSEYTYRFAIDGRPDPVWVGKVGTFPSADLRSGVITLAFASCARTGSNAVVFDEIRRLAPDLFTITGDFHYRNIATNDFAAFADAYDGQLEQPAQAALYREVPVAYMWDDHDFGVNDADHTSPSKPAAQAAYRAFVPHADLTLATTLGQSFDAGAVRVLLTDLRSERDPDEQTLLGAEQLNWLKAELLRARDDGTALVIWASPSPWVVGARADADGWGGFAAERRELANFVRDSRITNLLIVTGDAHMVAIDDGTNADYSTIDSTAPAPVIPVLAAAALDRRGGTKGGPFSEGEYPGAGQFGLVTIELAGDDVTVRLEGRTWDGRVLVEYQYSVRR